MHHPIPKPWSMDLLYSPYCRVTLTTTILISAFVIKERAFVIKKNIDLLLKKIWTIWYLLFFQSVSQFTLQSNDEYRWYYRISWRIKEYKLFWLCFGFSLYFAIFFYYRNNLHCVLELRYRNSKGILLCFWFFLMFDFFTYSLCFKCLNYKYFN